MWNPYLRIKLRESAILTRTTADTIECEMRLSYKNILLFPKICFLCSTYLKRLRFLRGTLCSTEATVCRLFLKIAVLKNFAIFTGKHLCWRPKACNFVKKRLQQRRFPVNTRNFLRTAFLIKHLRKVLLIVLTVSTFLHFSTSLSDKGSFI